MKKMLLGALAVLALSATAQADNNGAAKLNTVKQMYQRYFNNSSDDFHIVERVADAGLKKALRLEYIYGDKHPGEVGCIDWGIMSDSQDDSAIWGIPPNYVKRKPFQLSLLPNGRVKEKYSGVSYALSNCSGNQCKVSDVFGRDGGSLKSYLLKDCH